MKIIESFQHEEISGFKFGKSLIGAPSFYSHVYFVDGLLIDTGHKHMSQDILATIKDLPIEQIFITHYHEDHTGNIALLQNYFNCPVYSSAKCAEIMKDPPPISYSQKLAWGSRAAFDNIKVVADYISTQQYEFKIISTPGHSLDMVVLYEANRKWLFSADLFVSPYIAYFLREESIGQQILSIEKVLALDFDILLCGHNPQLQGGKDKLRKKLKFLQKFNDDVIAEYNSGKSPKQIMKSLQLREINKIKVLSRGALSRENMVLSVIRDYDSISN